MHLRRVLLGTQCLPKSNVLVYLALNRNCKAQQAACILFLHICNTNSLTIVSGFQGYHIVLNILDLISMSLYYATSLHICIRGFVKGVLWLQLFQSNTEYRLCPISFRNKLHDLASEPTCKILIVRRCNDSTAGYKYV